MMGKAQCKLKNRFMLLLCFEALPEKKRILLKEIFKLYEASVYFVSLKYLHNKEDAEDNMVQTFINLSKVLNRIEPDIKSKRNRAFIHKAARFTALDFLKKGKNDSLLYTRLEEPESYSEDINLEDYKLYSLVGDMEKVSKPDTELMVLKYVYNFKNDEIAEITGLTVANVKVKLHRAKAKLRNSENIQSYKEGD